MSPPPSDDRTGRIRAVPAAYEDHHHDSGEQVINVRIGWRQSARVKTLAVLLGGASVPAAIMTGVVPWGMRLAGIAMKSDIDTMKADISAGTKARQTADDLAAKRDAEIKTAFEVHAAGISTLKASIRTLTQKLSKRPARAEVDDRP